MIAPSSTQELQVELDVMLAADLNRDQFRKLVANCNKARRIVICRHIATTINLDVRPDLIQVLLEFDDDSIRFEVHHILEDLSAEKLDTLLNDLLQYPHLQVQNVAIDAIGKNKRSHFIPTMISLWDRSEMDIKKTLASALAAFGTLAIEIHLIEFLKHEKEEQVIQHLLNLAIRFRKPKMNKVFASYIFHPNPTVRFSAARGLSLSATRFQSKEILKALQMEQEHSILEMFIRAHMRFPNRKLASFLFETSINHSDAKIKQIAILDFRQLPDGLIWPLCNKALDNPSEEIRIFALTELSFLELPQISALLQNIIVSDKHSETQRVVAIEGLVNHNSPQTREFLFNFFLANQEDIYLGYVSIVSLKKVWQEEDTEQLAKTLELDEEIFSMQIQIVLDLLKKKLSALKWKLNPKIIPILYNRLNSENLNICILSLEVLAFSGVQLHLKKILPVLEKEPQKELMDTLLPILSDSVLYDPLTFFDWLDDAQRTEAQKVSAISACKTIRGEVNQEAEFFFQLLIWKHQNNDEYLRPLLKSIFQNLLDDAKVRLEVKKRLKVSEYEITQALLSYSGDISVVHLCEMAEDYFLELADRLTGEDLRYCFDALSRMKSKAARGKLLRVYVEGNELKPLAAQSLRRYIGVDEDGS